LQIRRTRGCHVRVRLNPTRRAVTRATGPRNVAAWPTAHWLNSTSRGVIARYSRSFTPSSNCQAGTKVRRRLRRDKNRVGPRAR
jgi:hypothetical protein